MNNYLDQSYHHIQKEDSDQPNPISQPHQHEDAGHKNTAHIPNQNNYYQNYGNDYNQNRILTDIQGNTLGPYDLEKLMIIDDSNKSDSNQKSDTNLQHYKKFLTSSSEMMLDNKNF